ncbi:MAG: hypothetical protein H7138_21475, partial [Myxococcales bacterium]|nr:hypothetical protein [Myxococcales bacterium]
EVHRASQPIPTQPPTNPSASVPSMIVQPSQPAPPHLAVTSSGVLDLSTNVLPDSWMVDPNTDLLRGHRIKSMRNAAIALAVIVVLGVAIFFAASRVTEDDQPRVVTPALAPDAAVPVVELPDAGTGLSRDEITARSRFGFFSITATARTQIYIDNKLIGDTPLTRWPVLPGPHRVKAIGPRGKIKLVNITIYGGQDTDEGTITW